jgi:hypothetical protein
MEPGGAAGAHYDPAGKKLAAALAWITKMTGGIASRPSRCLPMASDGFQSEVPPWSLADRQWQRCFRP